MARIRFSVDLVSDDPALSNRIAKRMAADLDNYLKGVLTSEAEIRYDKEASLSYHDFHVHKSTRRNACQKCVEQAQDMRS